MAAAVVLISHHFFNSCLLDMGQLLYMFFVCLLKNLETALKRSEYNFNLYHRKRIELEDKAKVVASVWGTESLPR